MAKRIQTALMIILLSSWWWALPSAFARDLVTSAVAQVDNHVITLREVRMNALVDRALYGALGLQQDLATQIQGVIVEWSVFLEAESFSFSTVAKREVEKKIEEIQGELRDNSEWSTWEVTDQELADMVRRKLVAKSFMDFKSTSSRVPVSDEEALSYFQKNQAKFGSLSFDAFKDSIVKYLVQNQLESRLREWLELLHKKYNVRLYSLSATQPGAAELNP